MFLLHQVVSKDLFIWCGLYPYEMLVLSSNFQIKLNAKEAIHIKETCGFVHSSLQTLYS